MDAVHNTMSLNRKKIKATSSCNRLYNEYTRDETTADHYDDGHRMINTDKTADNILLADETGDVKLDAYRKHIIKDVNEARKGRKEVTADDAPKSKKTLEERERWAKLSNSNRQRALRKDTVDLIGNVIQLGNGALETLTEEQQIEAYKSAFNVLKNHPDDYGKVLVASIHRDESSMHLQVMTSAIDEHEMKSRAKEMFGNRSKMSDDQTKFVERVQADLKSKGLDIDINRGLKRVDNPEYTNFRDEMLAKGVEVNRYSDNQLLNSQKEVATNNVMAKTTVNNMAFDAFDSMQKLRNSPFRYNQLNVGDINDDTKPASHFLRTVDGSPFPVHAGPDDRKQAKAEKDVTSMNNILNGDHRRAFGHIARWSLDHIDNYFNARVDDLTRFQQFMVDTKRDVLTRLHAEKWLPNVDKNGGAEKTIDMLATGAKKLRRKGEYVDDGELLQMAISKASNEELAKYSDDSKRKLEEERVKKRRQQQIDDGPDL